MGLLALLVASALPSSSGSNTLDTIYIVVGILGVLVVVFGSAGLTGVWRSLKKSGIREAQLDQIIASQPTLEQIREKAIRDTQRDGQFDQMVLEVLGDGRNTKSLRTEVLQIKGAMSPNGLDTNQIGDIAKRTEKKVETLTGEVRKQQEDFAQHVGGSKAQHDMLWTAVRELQQK